MDLQKYSDKRNFNKTKEPTLKEEINRIQKGDLLHFVVQHHLARRDHYDFRLEWRGVLLSWAIPKGPSYNPKDKRLAIRVENHPYDYRNFEGTIPKGEYGGGTVMLWDEGCWTCKHDIENGLSEGSLKFTLNGQRLKGEWTLVKLTPKTEKQEDNWLLLKEKDSYSKENDGISEFVTSIRSGRTLDEIEQEKAFKTVENPFKSAEVQLAKQVDSALNSDEWLYEVKYDGYRILAFTESQKTRLITRNGNDFTEKFKDIARTLTVWAGSRAMVLDGEIVIIDEDGKTNFQALQNHIKKSGEKTLAYIVFDILSLGGKDLRKKPLIERKKILKELLNGVPSQIVFSKYVIGRGKECFEAASLLNLEGIVGKRADSPYSGNRNGDWIKLKCDNRQEFVIGGYTLSDKKTEGISSLLLGFYENGNLKYAGRAGTGISLMQATELETKFNNIISDNCPFVKKPHSASSETVTWLKPLYVAEIKFSELTKDNLLRQASFKGLRSDKNPEDIVMETTSKKQDKKQKEMVGNSIEIRESPKNGSIIIGGITVTNPDKIIYEQPLIKKGEVVKYYESVSERMLPFIRNRVLSLIRCPKGIASPCFFNKHMVKEGKGIEGIDVKNSEGIDENFFYIKNAYGLLSEAQMGTVEFHAWGSRIENIEKPDIMVFDLDPDEGMDIERIRQGVTDLKSVLEELSLRAFLKTSGGKGYHVVVPLKPSVNWSVFRDFAKRIAELMESKWEDRYTSNIRKDKRKGKIFIDWVRNGRGATSVAPYSLRARAGATVSMPISWEELYTVTPNGITISDALSRLDYDVWKGFYETEQSLK